MPTNITDAALRFLAIIRDHIRTEQYLKVVCRADAIRKARAASWLGRVHCELALNEVMEDRAA